MNFHWPILPEYLFPVLILGVLVISLDLYFKTAGRRGLRWFFWVFSTIALYGLIVPPTYQKIPPSIEAIISDSEFDLPDSLLSENTKLFQSFDDFLNLRDQYKLDTILVISNGLPNWQLAALDQAFGYISLPLSEGILSVQADPAYANAPFSIAGELLIRNNLELHLITPDGANQTEKINVNDPFFMSELVVSTTGNTLIKLIGIRNADTLFVEHFPIHVANKPIRKTLLITGFPTFESRYLTEYLEELGHEIIIHQQLTKDHYQTHFYNRSSLRNFSPTQDLIAEQDLIILDNIGFESLSNSLKKTLLARLQQGKLGLIWLDEATKQNIPALKKVENQNTQRIEMNTDNGTISLKTFDKIYAGEPILYKKHLIARQLKIDFGTVCQPVFADGYRLILNGQEHIYRMIWNEILSSSLGKVSTEPAITIDPFARIGNRYNISILTNQPEKWIAEGAPLAPRQNELTPNSYEFSYWPKSIGWQPLMKGDSITYYVYHGKENAWNTHYDRQQQLKTKLASQRSRSKTRQAGAINVTVNPWLFFSLLLVSLSILWIEQRIRS